MEEYLCGEAPFDVKGRILMKKCNFLFNFLNNEIYAMYFGVISEYNKIFFLHNHSLHSSGILDRM